MTEINHEFGLQMMDLVNLGDLKGRRSDTQKQNRFFLNRNHSDIKNQNESVSLQCSKKNFLLFESGRALKGCSIQKSFCFPWRTAIAVPIA
jgi:hypothetical protein